MKKLIYCSFYTNAKKKTEKFNFNFTDISVFKFSLSKL